MDLGIEVILKVFSQHGLQNVFSKKLEVQKLSENARRILALKDEYIKTIEQVILFLQGHNPTLARQVCSMNFLPEASRFNTIDDLEFAFGNMGLQDKAKHLCTLYLEDIADFIVECIDENFGFSRYAERLGRSANSFDELYEKLSDSPTFIDEITLATLKEKMESIQPKMVCFSVPFHLLYSKFAPTCSYRPQGVLRSGVAVDRPRRPGGRQTRPRIHAALSASRLGRTRR